MSDVRLTITKKTSMRWNSDEYLDTLQSLCGSKWLKGVISTTLGTRSSQNSCLLLARQIWVHKRKCATLGDGQLASTIQKHTQGWVHLD